MLLDQWLFSPNAGLQDGIDSRSSHGAGDHSVTAVWCSDTWKERERDKAKEVGLVAACELQHLWLNHLTFEAVRLGIWFNRLTS